MPALPGELQADARALTNDDVEVLQSYVESKAIGGLPVNMRIGRQSLKLGKGRLVGDLYSVTNGHSFDGIRLTCNLDRLTVDAFAFKLAETMQGFDQGDIDFYGLYAAYQVNEALQCLAYHFLVRDVSPIDDSPDSVWPVDL